MAKTKKTASKATTKASSKARTKAPQKANSVGGHTLSHIIKEGGLYLLLAIGLYLFICLISYSQQDPGPYQMGAHGPVENWGGAVGAWIADFMFNIFGKMAYLVIVLIGAAVWHLLDDKDFQNEDLTATMIISPIIGFVFAMIGATALDNLYIQNPQALPYVSGGMLGDLTRQSILPKFGVVGSTLMALGLFLSGVTMVTRLSWFKLMDWLGTQGFALWDKAKAKFSGISDEIKGAQERKRRTESVSSIREKIISKKPPRIAPKISIPKLSKRVEAEKQMPLFTSETSGELPPLSLLDPVQKNPHGYSEEELKMMSILLVKKLKDFNIDITVETVQPGPVITRFEIELAPGIKASTVVGLARDLARAISVVSIRVVENIPGKSVMGIEIPNQSREIVYLLESLSSSDFEKQKGPLPIALGKDIAGNSVVTELSKTPHLLVAGTTGSGKSVCINTLIMSLVYSRTPEQVRLIMVDPKMLELSVYDGIPHLLAPVVTDMRKAANALKWCIVEMDRRFLLMAKMGVRNIGGYNDDVSKAIKDGTPLKDPLFEADPLRPELEAEDLTTLPYIVVIVDELADLMMITKKKIEEVIIRIAQRARAAGIHLVLATQRPSVDVVTGLIKANVPSRIAFQVSSRADSRTVLDQMGAEQLLGQGDMLYMPPGTAYPMRVHGAFVSDDEVKKVTEHLRNMGDPVYIDEITEGDPTAESGDGSTYAGGDDSGGNEADALYDRALYFVTKERKASISAVQRYLRVGYNRAARMIETMEQDGVVGPLEHGKREIFAPPPVDID
ncbi:MAG: DNA translocase FtsK 4TM domain-containing protein [Arenicellales bacterium]